MKIKFGIRKHPISIILKVYVAGLISAYIVRYLYLPFLSKKRRSVIVLHGHRLNGNLKAFADWLVENQKEYGVAFMSDDPRYHRVLKSRADQRIELLSIQHPKQLAKAASSSVIVTSHGPMFMTNWSSAKKRPLFVELWHGAGFKDRNKDKMVKWLFYDGVFVSSETYVEFHKKWGYEEEQLFVTGYAQTDMLAKKPNRSELNDIKKAFGISRDYKKVVLVAPTWQSVDGKLQLLSTPVNEFLSKLNDIGKRNDTLFLLLPHINSELNEELPELPNVRVVSKSGEQDIKPLLHVTDVLVTDWSSVYTDFLALPDFKPVIFMDIKPNFKGFTLTPDDRAGKLVGNTNELVITLNTALKDSAGYLGEYRKEMARVKRKVWGDTLDGKSSQRYFEQIKRLF